MAERYVLAFDLGTSALKAALVSFMGRVAALESVPVRLHLLPGGGAEQDPSEWWAALVAAARRLLARGVARPDQVAAICCTAQWSATVAVDRSGRPLMRAISWMDTRGAPDVARLTDGPISISGYGVDKLWRWVRRTGGIPGRAGKDSLAHILYIRRARPDVYAATHKFLEPKDYLNLRLTGEFASTYEAMTLHWVTDNRDPYRIRYDPDLLAAAGLDRSQLPDLLPATAVLGRLRPAVAEELGLRPDTHVVAGTPDIHAAAIGSGATRDLEPHLYVGTSAWISAHVPYLKTDLLHNMASIPAAILGRYLIANEQEAAGACLLHVRDLLTEPCPAASAGPDATLPDARPGHPAGAAAERPAVADPGPLAGSGAASLPPAGAHPGPAQVPDGALERLLALAAAVPPGSDGLLFTPWLYGERTPVEDPWVRGGFHNLSLRTTRGHLVRAVLEGVACNARWLLGAVESFARRRMEPLRIIGGGARSPLWCQIFADVLNRVVQQVDRPVEANVRGAGLLALVGLGELGFGDIPDLVAVARTFEPDPAHRRTYDELFAAFVAIYRRNRGLYARLNRRAAAP